LITWDCCTRDCGKLYGTFHGSGFSFMYIQITSIEIERNLPLEATVTNQEVIAFIHDFPDPPSLICCQPWWLLLHKFLTIPRQTCTCQSRGWLNTEWNGQGHSAQFLWRNRKISPVDRCTYD
jgi:hypothetical protein